MLQSIKEAKLLIEACQKGFGSVSGASPRCVRIVRPSLLAREVFDTLLEAEVLIERWRKAYKTVRPHSSLGYRPPAPESRRPCPLGSAAPHQAGRGEPLAGQPS